MRIYHSSSVRVAMPDVVHSRDYLDFGKGFYLTTLLEQALSYAQRFQRRNRRAWLNEYELDYNPAEWKILEFNAYDADWLDFISKCRAGKDDSDYDMVIGGIANDKVIRTLDRYFEGEISAGQALGILSYEKPNMQLCIRNQKMLDQCVKHVGSKQL